MGTKTSSQLRRANEALPVVDAFAAVGFPMPRDYTGKVICPWCGERALRVYADHAYCFGCVRPYTSVTVYELGYDISRKEAIERVLLDAGVTEPTAAEVWHEATTYTVPVDTSALAEALALYCTRIAPDFATRQFEPEVGGVYSKVLGLLTRVHTQEEAERWLATCRAGMKKILTQG